MAPKQPGLKPLNVVQGSTPPPVAPTPKPPVTKSKLSPPVTAPKTFVPVTSSYGAGTSIGGVRPLQKPSKQNKGGTGFDITDLFSFNRLGTEIKATAELVKNAVPGLVTLAGGLGADLYHVVLNDFTGSGYSFKTSEEFAKGFVTTFTPGHYVDYWHSLQNGQAITPMIVQDAANMAGLGSAIGKGLRAGAVAANASAETAAKAAVAAGKTEAGLASAAKAASREKTARTLADISETSFKASRTLAKPMQWSFKPYMWAAREAHAAYKTGAIPYFYNFKDGVPVTWETNAWGESAAKKYAAQIEEYKAANPEATMNDGNLADLVNKYNRHANIARGSLKAAVIRRAARDALFDSSQTYRAVMQEKKSPVHADDINPDTGEVWGELSPVEEQAVIATINGRAQLIAAMAEKTGRTPAELAILGRVDWTPELHLSPDGAELAVKFATGSAELSEMQYNRLSGAIEGIGKSVANITNKSLAGYGRATKMPLDYTVPTPHVNQLGQAIRKSGNKEAMDIFTLAEDAGVFDLPLNDPFRRGLIMRLVELLPDDLALDPSLYPAIERENLAFFNRVRKAIDNGEVGKILGEPLPEGPFGPEDYQLRRNRGKRSKAETMIAAGRQKVRKLEARILKIAEQIDKTEAAHAKKVDLVRRNDMVDAYVSGVAPKALARKYRMPLSEVEKILRVHPVAKAWRDVLQAQEAINALERTIGKKRAGMDVFAAEIEVEKMQAELELRKQEAAAAEQRYNSAININETVREMTERGLDLDATRHERLYDDLYEAELELEIAGGNVEDIQIPLDEIPYTGPMTIGRAGAHFEELNKRIDEQFSREVAETSPEIAADVDRVKTLINASWRTAENAFFDSPIEETTVIAQARIEQLGNLFESIIKSSQDAVSFLDNTLNNKKALNVLSGVTSPFDPYANTNRVINKKLINDGQFPDPIRTTKQRQVFDGELIPGLDPTVDYKQQLLDMANEVEPPPTYMGKADYRSKKETPQPGSVFIDYDASGYPDAYLEITYDSEGVSTADLHYEIIDSTHDRRNGNTGRHFIELSLPAGKSVMERVYGPSEAYAASPQTLTSVLKIIDEAIKAWDEFKKDPFNSPPLEDIYAGIHETNGQTLPVRESLQEGTIRFEFPNLEQIGKTEAARQKAMEAINSFDELMTNFSDFVHEVFGPDIAYVESSRALLKNPAVIDGAPIPTLRTPEIVGAVELTAELEGYAKTAVEDPVLLDELRAERDDVVMIEKWIDEVNNPSPETIANYRQSQINDAVESLNTIRGVAETNLGANWNRSTDRVTWSLTPIKGAPEWDWWYRLDAKTRRNIARDYFQSATLRNNTIKGPKLVRRAASSIDEYASDANMSIDEFADAMLESIQNMESAKRNIQANRFVSDESLKEEFSRSNSDEAYYELDKFSLTGDEYNAVISRAEYLARKRPNPIEVEKLRPIANTPDEVVVDETITSASVRSAAYEADVLEAMAKDASAKMKKAERLADRLSAFEEYIIQSAKYRSKANNLIKKQKASEKTRLQQIKREERLRNLRERERLGKNQVRRLTKVLDEFAASEGLEQFNALDRGLPLRTALEPGYPSEQFPVEYITPEGVPEQFELSGPMYLPSGAFEQRVGGLRSETVREGYTGHNKSTNEHYRQGERHTIFSIRLIADRLGKDMGNMTLNEKFRAVIAQWGKKVSDVLGDEILADLQARAERKAIATPYEIVDEARQAGLLDEDGLQAYNAGFEDPKRMYELAVAIEYGKLIDFEMVTRGLDAVDPYAPLEKRIGISRINGDAMYVEKGIKESLAKQTQIFDPNKFSVAWRGMAKVTSLFKVSTLALSATWQLGDIISTFIIANMVGVRPADLIARMKQVKIEEYGPGLRTMLDPNAELPPIQGATTIAVESPTQDVGLSQNELAARQGRTEKTQLKSRLNRISKGRLDYPKMLQGRRVDKVSFKVNETINRISRHAFFLELFEKELNARGLTIDTVFNDQSWRYDQTIHDLVFDVADSANKWLGDFSDLSMAERKYITPFYPFYAWTKHIHKVFVALGMDHPQSLAWYIYMGTLNYDPNEDPMGLRSGSFGLFGGVASANFINPLGDLAEGPMSYLWSGDRSRLTRGMGPVPRLLGGLGAGFDVANWQDVERPAESYIQNQLGRNISPLTNVSDILGFTANQFPIVKRTLQALPTGQVPLTSIATGAVSTYPTGQARLNPYTQEPIRKWGGQPAAIARLFSIPGIPYQTDKQIKQVEEAARKRLMQIQFRNNP